MVKYPFVVYIGPEKGNPLVFDARNPGDVHVVCDGVHSFVRLMDEKEYSVRRLLRFENLHI
jgi:hypothetical protein